MRTFTTINWFAVRTKRFRETLASSGVAALGLEAFLPMIKVESAKDVVIRCNSKPLFPGYFFARFNSAISLQAVESARGVVHVIKSGVLPVPVDDEIVREIQDRVEADGLICLQKRELKIGERVSIQEGPFAGMMGKLEAELDDRRRVAILLETLWNARIVIDKRWLDAEAA
jgi:transcriptional antiterminator RfaH